MPIGTIAAAGFASGLNLYATALLLGLSGRLGWAETPEAIQGNGALAALAGMVVVEFVVDKVPWLDSVWDTVHTVIRPIGGALLGIGLDTGGTEVAAALVGGGFALPAHGAKASTRAVANLSPEPVSNAVLSVSEDGLVVAMVTLALAYPVAAGVAAVALAVVGVGVTLTLLRALQRLRRRRAERGRVAAPSAEVDPP